MTDISFKKRLKFLSYFISTGRWRELFYIVFWIYPLIFNSKLQYLLVNRIFPKLGIDIMPPFAEIECTTICDKKCIMCEHTYWKEKSIHMTFEQFKHIYDQFGNLKWVGLTGIGSAYLNPDYPKMIAYAKSKGTVIEIMDHFNHMNEEKIRELIDVGPEIFFISIYGTNQKTYGKVCVNGDWNKVLRNLKLFAKIKKEKKAHFPILNFNYIVSKYTEPEIYTFLDIIAELDTDLGEVLITPIEHSFKEVEKYVTHIPLDEQDKIRAYAEEKGIDITFNQAVTEAAVNKRPINQCTKYLMPFVFVTGHVIPCCGINEANIRDLQKETAMGNIFEKPLKEIWYGERFKQFRKIIRDNKLPAVCKLCPVYDKSGLKPIDLPDN